MGYTMNPAAYAGVYQQMISQMQQMGPGFGYGAGGFPPNMAGAYGPAGKHSAPSCCMACQ